MVPNMLHGIRSICFLPNLTFLCSWVLCSLVVTFLFVLHTSYSTHTVLQPLTYIQNWSIQCLRTISLLAVTICLLICVHFPFNRWDIISQLEIVPGGGCREDYSPNRCTISHCCCYLFRDDWTKTGIAQPHSFKRLTCERGGCLVIKWFMFTQYWKQSDII